MRALWNHTEVPCRKGAGPYNICMESHEREKLEKLWDLHNQSMGSTGTQEQVMTLFRPLAKYVLAAAASALMAFAAWVQIQIWGQVGKVPIGGVLAWPSDQPVPTGWHSCDGSSVACNAELFASLNNLYGNKFDKQPAMIALPNFQGDFLRGQGSGSGRIGEEQPATVNARDISWRDDSDVNSGLHTREPFLPRAGSFPTPSGNAEKIVLIQGLKSSEQWGSIRSAYDETRPKNYAVRWIMRIG